VLFLGTVSAQMRSGKLGVGAGGAYYLFQSDRDKAKPSFGGALDVTYSMTEYLGLRVAVGGGQLRTESGSSTFSTMLVHAHLGLSLDLSPNGSVNPFLFVGAAGQYADPRLATGEAIAGRDGKKSLLGNAVGGAGLDIFFSEFFSMTLAAEGSLPMTDRLDGLYGGTNKDMFQRISLGFRYYFFDQDFIARMLKALEERYRK
jgi:hypothetical protein